MRRTDFERVEVTEEICSMPPDGAVPRVLYVEGDPVSLVGFYCPCNCGDWCAIPTRLVVGSACWQATLRDGRLTLSPSLLRTSETCRAHFFIRENRVDWC